MKTLLLFRHAKSSWDDADLADQDRPLNGRGRKTAAKMGLVLRKSLLPIDQVLCSTSNRTRETADIAFAEFAKHPPISYRDDLYLATPDQLLRALSELDDHLNCVMLIGHNPGFEQLLEQLLGTSVRFPTAALAWLELQVSNWSQCNQQPQATMKQIWRPKELTKD